jgi:TDG/mug DNA glycosylase family protein
VILPDVLAPGLRVVFCGTAAGARSARLGAYYAGPGNRFWPTLHEIGLTPRRLEPAEFARALESGIGLTDLAKRHSGADADLPPDAFDRDGLRARIAAHRPRLLAFTSLTAAAIFLGRRRVTAGEQPERIGATRLFALPSPSGRARGHWSIAPWRALASAARGVRAADI